MHLFSTSKLNENAPYSKDIRNLVQDSDKGSKMKGDPTTKETTNKEKHSMPRARW